MKQAASILLLIIYTPVIVFASRNYPAIGTVQTTVKQSTQQSAPIPTGKACKPVLPQKQVPAKAKSQPHAQSVSSDLPVGLSLSLYNIPIQANAFNAPQTALPDQGNSIWQPPRLC